MEDRQLHTQKFDFQPRLNKGLCLVWIFFICFFLSLNNQIISNADQDTCDESSLDHTWKEAVYALNMYVN